MLPSCMLPLSLRGVNLSRELPLKADSQTAWPGALIDLVNFKSFILKETSITTFNQKKKKKEIIIIN